MAERRDGEERRESGMADFTKRFGRGFERLELGLGFEMAVVVVVEVEGGGG